MSKSHSTVSRSAVLRELTSNDGTLVFGVVAAPVAGVFFVSPDAGGGAPTGVAARLGAALAEDLSVPIGYRVFSNSGECTDAISIGQVNAAFMPVDDERRRKVAFGPAYYQMESTYLATESSGLMTVGDVDAAAIRVLGIANTTTIRASTRTLTKTSPRAVDSVGEAVELLRLGHADVLALSRDSLGPLVRMIPGSRILQGHFQQTDVAVAVPRMRAAALAYAGEFLENAKATGLVRRIFDDAGLNQEVVAPPATPTRPPLPGSGG